ncbi:AAA family ATPase [Limobrevibacterium gyesilva]|uniref:AAA family ATPase n=1 Tax=Limobrevibacterium gyesilva TaxID=2991712 RepID=A0AA42CGR4_9PROT|nr:AAA family ATPase [Limobrevibacterium gyesilva]MCW3474110.1 AAA family ATPase [Limobrevibacterium gyesilva]
MLTLSALRRRPDHTPDAQSFPWSLPLVRDLDALEFIAPVTFLVGENGSGKSTLLEGIAAGMHAVAAGRRDLPRDPSLAAARAFAEGFLFVRRRHARTRLFLRAEDVFGFTQRIGADMHDLDADARDIAASIPEGYGRNLALGVVRGQRAAFARSYGENPDGQSHGETFLALLRRRLVPNGLYFLDEPETPLSPTRVLALMALVAELAGQGCQFVIATHSPILMALPGASILLAEGGRLRAAAWDDIEHVRVTRAFLANPAALLAKLLPS